jgi:hypothetical protein
MACRSGAVSSAEMHAYQSLDMRQRVGRSGLSRAQDLDPLHDYTPQWLRCTPLSHQGLNPEATCRGGADTFIVNYS